MVVSSTAISQPRPGFSPYGRVTNFGTKCQMPPTSPISSRSIGVAAIPTAELQQLQLRYNTIPAANNGKGHYMYSLQKHAPPHLTLPVQQNQRRTQTPILQPPRFIFHPQPLLQTTNVIHKHPENNIQHPNHHQHYQQVQIHNHTTHTKHLQDLPQSQPLLPTANVIRQHQENRVHHLDNQHCQETKNLQDQSHKQLKHLSQPLSPMTNVARQHQDIHMQHPKNHQHYHEVQIQNHTTRTQHLQDLPQNQSQHQHFHFSPKQIKSPNSDAPVLPPCRVCGDKSTGIHYGAMTCEACKGFFRRSLSRKNEFHCITGTQSCDIHYGGKTPCAFCRLAKCVAIGMSREGIKRGRYTLSQRTSHIKEVKALQESDSYSKQLLGKTPGGCMLAIPREAEVATQEKNVTYDNYQVLSKAILTAYLVHCQYPPEIEQNLEEIQHVYLKRKSLQDENISEYCINNKDLFTDIHENGWFVKDRLKVLHKRIQFIEEAIKKLVCFSKNLPGFKKLPMADQMTLVKAVQFNWWFLSIYPGMSKERQMYTTPLRDTVSRADIAEFMSENFAEAMFRLAGVFNGLQLSEEERALVLGLSVVSTDGCSETEDQASIEQIHEALAKSLYYLTKEMHPDQPSRFGRIVAALTELRSVEAPHVEEDSISRMKVEVPPLLLELWATLPRKR